MPTYSEKWKQAKRLFETTAKVKKPSADVTSFFRRKAGIDGALKKIDEAAAKKIGLDPNHYKAFVAAVTAYQPLKVNYLKVLEATVGKEPPGADKVAYQKGIAVLKTQLKSIDSSLKTAAATAKSSLAGRKPLAVMADNLMDLIESACDSAEAFITQVKADPTPARFNEGIQKAARDITQNIGNIEKLTKAGFTFAKEQPNNWFRVLSAWGNAGRRVQDTATDREVLRELRAFEQAVDGVRDWAK